MIFHLQYVSGDIRTKTSEKLILKYLLTICLCTNWYRTLFIFL